MDHETFTEKKHQFFVDDVNEFNLAEKYKTDERLLKNGLIHISEEEAKTKVMEEE